MTPHRSWIAVGLLLAGCAFHEAPYPPALPAPRVVWDNFEPLIPNTPPPPELQAQASKPLPVPALVPLQQEWEVFRPVRTTTCTGKGKRKRCTQEPASVVEKAAQQATVRPKAQNTAGGNSVLLTYPYEVGKLYEVHTTPTVGTSIVLPPGEVLATKPVLKSPPKEYEKEEELKDTWVVGYAAMTPGGQHQGVIVIRPGTAPQEAMTTLLFQSGLIIPLKLIAYPTAAKAMLMVSWAPPAQAAEPQARTHTPPEERPPTIDRSRIFTGYTVQALGKYTPPWLPVGVFDNGKRTYIRLNADALDAGQAPVVIGLTQQHQQALVQSRLWRGTRDAAIIVERLYPAFLMQDHAGLQVRIERQPVSTAAVQEVSHAR
jgi:type IV secretory pathway VirB9-like protein